LLYLYRQHYSGGPWLKQPVKSMVPTPLIRWCEKQVREVLPFREIRGVFALCYSGVLDSISSPGLAGIEWEWRKPLRAMHPDFRRQLYNGKIRWVAQCREQMELFQELETED